MTVELSTGEHKVEESEAGVRCDQCHADSGIKKRSKKTFEKAKSYDAKFEVTLNGAKMHLCEEHNTKLSRSLDKRRTTHTHTAREIE